MSTEDTPPLIIVPSQVIATIALTEKIGLRKLFNNSVAALPQENMYFREHRSGKIYYGVMK